MMLMAHKVSKSYSTIHDTVRSRQLSMIFCMGTLLCYCPTTQIFQVG